jgi:hypothetical protein
MDFAFLRYDDALQSAVSIATATGRPRMVNSLGGGAIHYPYVPLTPGSLKRDPDYPPNPRKKSTMTSVAEKSMLFAPQSGGKS